MSELIYNFFECENPKCRLRFPGTIVRRWANRCPVCRSNISIVAVANKSNEQALVYTNHQLMPMEALLDNIRSAWNVGSIFRTADGSGINKLYLCGVTPSPDNQKVIKTSLGAEENVRWEKSSNAVNLASRLKSEGYHLWALEDLPGAQSLFDTNLEADNNSTVLVVGNEISGIDPGVIGLCERVISIPMHGKKRSYNVAVAFGIAAGFLLYRQSVSQGSLKIFPNT